MPELLDIIVYLYYNNTEKKNIALIIENIFFDLSKNQINYYNIKNNILCYFINEWYNNAENKNLINNFILSENQRNINKFKSQKKQRQKYNRLKTV